MNPSTRSWSVKVLIALQLVCASVHFQVVKIFPYYRELFFAFFLIIILFSPQRKTLLRLPLSHPVVITIIFSLLVFLLSFLPSTIDPNLKYLSEQLDESSAKFYVFRSTVLYIPLLLSLFTLQLNRKYLILLGVLCTLTSYFSLFSWLTVMTKSPVGLFDFQQISFLSGSELNYNTYIPMIAYLQVFSINSLSALRSRLLLPLALLNVPIFFIVFLSTSRSSLGYIIFSFILCFYSDFIRLFLRFVRSITISHKSLLFSVVFIVLLVGTPIILSDYIQYSDKLSTLSLSSFVSSEARASILSSYVSNFNFENFFFGDGLSSILFSGPHNGYVRWIARSGIFIALLAYLPWILEITHLILIPSSAPVLATRIRNFFFSIVLFVPFFALFGYPTEDAYQSFFCFLSLGLSISFTSSLKTKA